MSSRVKIFFTYKLTKTIFSYSSVPVKTNEIRSFFHLKEEKTDKEPRQPADGDSEAEPNEQSPTGNGVAEGRKFSTSVVISVDNKGRLTSITDGQQVPSPTVKEGNNGALFYSYI